MTRQAEASLVDEIRLDLGREPDLTLWRNHIARGSVWDPNTGGERIIAGGLPPGSSDIIGILAPTGRLIALEVKKPGGRTARDREELQEAFLGLVRRRGGFAARVNSVAEARAAIGRARRGEAR